MPFYWIKGNRRAVNAGGVSGPWGPVLIEAATPEEAREVALRRTDYAQWEHVHISETREETEKELLWWCSGSGSLSLALTLEDAQSGSHQGDCEEDVRALRRFPYVRDQLAEWNAEEVREELKGYGAWDAEELSDEDMSEVRMLWLACGDIAEEAAQ